MLRRTPHAGALVAALLTTLTLVLPAAAEPGSDARSEVVEAEDRLEERRERLSDAEQRLAALDTRASRVVEEYNLARVRLTEAREELRRVRERAGVLRRDAAQLQQDVDMLVRRLHRSGPDSAMDLLLANPEGLGSATVLERLTDRQMASAEALQATREALSEEEARLAERRDRARAAAAEVEQRREAVQRRLDAQAEETAELRARVAAAEEDLTARRAEAAAAERRAAQVAAVETASTPPPGDGTSGDAAPADGSGDGGAPAAPVDGGAEAVVEAALSQVGKPYQWGGGGPDSYDCSGLTSWAWAHAGVSLPHSSRLQYDATRRIDRDELALGDLVFFGDPIHHVAMYIGDGRVVEAPYSGASVRVRDDALSRSDIVGYGRP